MGEDERGAGDGADLARACGDVLEGTPGARWAGRTRVPRGSAGNAGWRLGGRHPGACASGQRPRSMTMRAGGWGGS